MRRYVSYRGEWNHDSQSQRGHDVKSRLASWGEIQTTRGQQANTGKILFAMSLSLVLVIASMSSLNLSLPSLAVSVGATNVQLTWIVDAYTLALAATVLPMGSLGDRYGRRTVLLIGTVIFGLAAFAAGTMSTPEGIIGARAVMGLGAAMIMPGTLSTITAAFPPEKRARGVAAWAGFAGAGAVAGLLAAGVLLEVWDWPAIFFTSAIIAAISGVAALKFAPNTADEDHVALDLAGAVFSATGIGFLTYGIIHGGEQGWSAPSVLIPLGIGVVALIGFALWELRQKHPLLDVRLFRNRWFSTGALAVTAQFLAQLGFLFVAMQYLQLILGFSPLQSALGFIPLAVAVIPMSQLAPVLMKKFGAKPVMLAGLTLLAVGLAAMSRLTVDSTYPRFLGALLVFGVGVAWTATPATTAITSALPRAKQGVASAVNDTTRELGSALGVAIVGTIYASSYRTAITPATENLPERAREAVLSSPAAGIHVAEQGGSQGTAIIAQIEQAFMAGATDAMRVVAILLAGVAIAVAILAPRRMPVETAIDQE